MIYFRAVLLQTGKGARICAWCVRQLVWLCENLKLILHSFWLDLVDLAQVNCMSIRMVPGNYPTEADIAAGWDASASQRLWQGQGIQACRPRRGDIIER